MLPIYLILVIGIFYNIMEMYMTESADFLVKTCKERKIVGSVFRDKRE